MASTGSSSDHPAHWSVDQRSYRLIPSRPDVDDPPLDQVLSQSVNGGSDHGQLIFVSAGFFRNDRLRLDPLDHQETTNNNNNSPHPFHVVVDVDGQAVSGFTRRDFLAWLGQRLDASGAVQLTTAPLTGSSFI